MKKTTRVLVALLALTLVTSCFVGGTFAKYIVSDNTSDSARVAKFGVNVFASGDEMFTNVYADENGDSGFTNTVESDVKVVAPGTADADGVKFAITGTPEVAVDVTIAIADGAKDVFLKAGTYDDVTTGDDSDEYVLAADYYPVKWTLTNKAGDKLVDGKTLADIETAIEAEAAKYPAGTTFDELYTITWAWAFEQDDKADTILGDIIAGTYTTDAANYCTDIDYDLTITVTQID